MLPEYLLYGFDKKWWHIADWAEVYKKGFGHYPEGGMGQYGMSICYFDLNGNAPVGGTAFHDPDLPLFLFETNKYGQIIDVSHNPSAEGISNKEACGHTLADFMENIDAGGAGYIYDPVLPPYEKKIFGNVDWREIIYQMAVDYFKHNQEPDFYYNVAKKSERQKQNVRKYKEILYEIVLFFRSIYRKYSTRAFKEERIPHEKNACTCDDRGRFRRAGRNRYGHAFYRRCRAATRPRRTRLGNGGRGEEGVRRIRRGDGPYDGGCRGGVENRTSRDESVEGKPRPPRPRRRGRRSRGQKRSRGRSVDVFGSVQCRLPDLGRQSALSRRGGCDDAAFDG